jgi:hypothetical protein
MSGATDGLPIREQALHAERDRKTRDCFATWLAEKAVRLDIGAASGTTLRERERHEIVSGETNGCEGAVREG